jgi:uncharacterized protein YndB with AHSA1/START domain
VFKWLENEGNPMKWPSGMEPESVPVYARNEIEIAAPPERVWRWLIAGERWPRWYGNCTRFSYTDGQRGPDLAEGRSFKWRTFASPVRSIVKTFEPCRELGWDARAPGLYAYHGWLLEPAGARCRVVTEETQRGWLPAPARWYLRRMLLRGHQGWLQDLRRMAESGDPPSVRD